MARVDTTEADGGRKKRNQAADLAVHPEPHRRERCRTCRRSETPPPVVFLLPRLH